MKILILIALFTVSVFAKTYEHKDLDFSLKSLNSSDIHYSFKLLSRYKLSGVSSRFKELLRSGMSGAGGNNLVFVKSVFVVDKPYSFFSHPQMMDLNYNKVVTGASRVSSKSKYTLRFQNNGLMAYSYDMTLHVESFDINLANENSSSIFDTFRDSDSSLGGAKTMALRFGRNFSSKGNGSIALTNHIPVGNKTIFVTYSIVSLKPLYAWGDVVESNVLKEIKSLKVRTDQY